MSHFLRETTRLYALRSDGQVGSVSLSLRVVSTIPTRLTGVERDLDGRMTQQLLHHLRMVAGGQQNRRAAVPVMPNTGIIGSMPGSGLCRVAVLPERIAVDLAKVRAADPA